MKRIIILFSVFMLLVSGFALAKNEMNEKEFQNYIFEYSSNNFTNFEFKKDADSTLILVNGMEIGLVNMYKIYKLEKLSQTELNAVLKTQISELLSKLGGEKPKNTGWEKAHSLVRPQFVTLAYTKNYSFVFDAIDEYVASSFVIDDEISYVYVNASNLVEWKIEKDLLTKVATQNLTNLSKGMQLQSSFTGEKYIAVQVLDGYDAARLLIPEFRAYVEEKLGVPFYAAIPNRDFLFMWSKSNSKDFDNKISNQVKKDFSSRPYPLTPNILIVSKNKIEPRR